jgi:hypothetical protein
MQNLFCALPVKIIFLSLNQINTGPHLWEFDMYINSIADFHKRNIYPLHTDVTFLTLSPLPSLVKEV